MCLLKGLDNDFGKSESTSTLIAPPPASIIKGFLLWTAKLAKGFGNSVQAEFNKTKIRDNNMEINLNNARHQGASKNKKY